MRGLIVNYVRQRTARKRGGEFTLTSSPDNAGSPEPSVDLERLDSALTDLASLIRRSRSWSI